MAPSKAETALLPAFQGLSPEQVHVPKTRAECQSAVDEILSAGRSGFDTEAKPTFRAGQRSDGPHVVQFALNDKAFIFQLHRSECEEAAAELIASKHVLKVGFGLKNDRGQIRSRLGITLTHELDLDQVFRRLGYSGLIGVRGAMGALLKLGRANPTFIHAQLLDASKDADDADAPLRIMEALQKGGHLEP